MLTQHISIACLQSVKKAMASLDLNLGFFDLIGHFVWFSVRANVNKVFHNAVNWTLWLKTVFFKKCQSQKLFLKGWMTDYISRYKWKGLDIAMKI